MADSLFYQPLNPLFIRVLDPLRECHFNARKVPSKAPQFSKKQQLRRFF